jgi:hypothetical protein
MLRESRPNQPIAFAIPPRADLTEIRIKPSGGPWTLILPEPNIDFLRNAKAALFGKHRGVPCRREDIRCRNHR